MRVILDQPTPIVRPGKLFFLASVAALTSLGIDMSLPGIPWVEADLGARAGHGALSSSLFMAGFAVMPLVGGPLSDSLGRSRVMLISLGVYAPEQK